MSENDEPLTRELNITADIIECLKDSEFAAEWLKAQDEGEEMLHADLESLTRQIAELTTEADRHAEEITHLRNEADLDAARIADLTEFYHAVIANVGTGETPYGYFAVQHDHGCPHEQGEFESVACTCGGDKLLTRMRKAYAALRARATLEGKDDA